MTAVALPGHLALLRGGLGDTGAEVPTLLCVDDEQGILDAYQHHLSPPEPASIIRSARSARPAKEQPQSAFRVLLADSGRRAIEIAERERRAGRRIQVAFFDMNLPDALDGLETMQRVRAVDPDILCVFATASQDYTLEDITRYFPPDSLDEWDYLNKPFTANEIMQKARNLTASWFRRRHEESLLARLDEAKRTLETQVAERTHQLTDANAALLEKHQELENLIRSKDEFLATVSHELRTPLTAVVGLAEELRDQRSLFDDREIDEFVTTIAEQSRDVAHIIEDLLVSARADVGTVTILPESVDLRAEVDDVLHSGSLHRDAAHRLSVEGKGALAWADASRVRQILRNLIVNALRYGGDHIHVSVGISDGSPHVQVRDDGVGLPADEVERVFEPYERAHSVPTQPGSVGLGLAVSRRLSRLMGGDVVYRRDDTWTVFEVVLSPLP